MENGVINGFWKKINSIEFIFYISRLRAKLLTNQINGVENGESARSEVTIDEINEVAEQGKALYNMHCAGCHGSIELSSIKDVSVGQIQGAFQRVPQMVNVANLGLDIEAIAQALSSSEIEEITPGLAKFSCDNPNSRSLASVGLKRLTQFEMKQTIRKIFGEKIYSQTESTLGIFPQEVFIEGYEEFNPSIDSALFDSWFTLVTLFAKKVSEEPELRNEILPSTLINSFGNITFENGSAVTNFVSSYGLKVFRRPLTSEQLNLYDGILKGNESFHEFNRHRLEAMIGAMLLSPEFITHLREYDQQNGDLYQLDSYTVANRISYALTGSSPDASLFSAAQSQQLANKEDRRRHAERLANSPDARRFSRNLFRHILHTDKASEPSALNGQELNINTNQLRRDLTIEALNFVEHTIFESQGNFSELLTSKKAFPPSLESSKIFGTSSSQGSG